MQWRDIEGFNGVYQVSDHGQVRNANSGIILCQKLAGSTVKYPFVVLCNKTAGIKDAKKKYVRKVVHRLVASAFIPNPHDKPEVNHIDSNPLNNSVGNLEWVTHSENMRHAYEYGNATKRKKRVIRDDGVEYSSVSAAARAMNYDVSNLSKACRDGWRVRGYHFRFAE